MKIAISLAILGSLVLSWSSSGATSLVITSFQGNGQLSWTNALSNADYRIEWASELANGGTVWTSSWEHLTKITSTSPNVTSAVPMFYRIVGTQPHMFHFPDYFPTDPNVAGSTRIYEITNFPGSFLVTNKLVDFIRIPFLSGPIYGIRFTEISARVPYEGYVYNDGKSVFFLGEDRECLSTDTNLTAHPLAWRWSSIYEGLIVTQKWYKVNLDSHVAREHNEQKILCKIDEVTIPLGTYKNAIVHWYLDLDKPYTKLNFYGIDTQLGVTLPTRSETQGHSVTAFEAYGIGAGIILSGDVEANTGNLNDLRRLLSMSHD